MQEVHVWYCLTAEPPWPTLEPRYLAVLSQEEQARYRRFMFDKDRRQFLLARVLVRTVLSRYAPRAPAEWEFEYSPHGKPRIAARFGLTDLQFNHSHADELVACAVTHHHAVGVDVESAERAVDLKIARYCLSPRELREFEQLKPAEQRPRLMRQWTLKEAYAKVQERKRKREQSSEAAPSDA